MKLPVLLLGLMCGGAALSAANVRDFGAVGDGRTDDTVALQAAIDRADGLLELPRGDYRITRPLLVDLGVVGRTSVSGRLGGGRIVMDGPGPALRIRGHHTGTSGPDSFAPGVFDRERMPQLDGFEITGTHPEADGIEVEGVMQLIVRGVLIQGVRHGLRLTGVCRNVILDGIQVYDCRGVGVYFDRLNLHQVIVKGSHLSFCHLGGIRVEKSEIRNLQIVGNDIEYNFDRETNEDVSDILLDAREGNIREGTISGNTIQSVTYLGPRRAAPADPARGPAREAAGAAPAPRLGANVRLIGADGPNRVGKFAISGNLISSRQFNIDLVNARGVTVSGNSLFAGQERSLRIVGSRNIVVDGNTIDRNPLYEPRARAGVRSINGILVRDSDGVLLNANQVEASDAGSPADGAAIDIRDSQGVTVTSCQVFEPAFRGIQVRGGHGVVISHCTILDRRPDSGLIASIVLDGVRDAVVTGNLAGRGTEDGIAVRSNTTATLSANRILEGATSAARAVAAP